MNTESGEPWSYWLYNLSGDTELDFDRKSILLAERAMVDSFTIECWLPATNMDCKTAVLFDRVSIAKTLNAFTELQIERSIWDIFHLLVSIFYPLSYTKC